MKKVLISILVFGLVGLISGLGIQVARAVTTDLDITMTGEPALVVSSSATASFTDKTVDIAAQNSTATIANVSVTDERGTGAGWSATMTSTHFTTRATHKTITDTDSDGIDGFTGTYDGLDGVLDPNGTFIVEITTGGAVGTAVFKWTNPVGSETANVTTASTNTLSNGITVDWTDAAIYDVGDKFSCGVDVFPYTDLEVVPGTITAASGNLSGVTAGSTENLAGTGATSDAKTLMTAAVDKGFGDYDQASALTLTIHANSLAGSFTATATITVS